MNREEAIKYLALIKIAYPASYKDMDSDSARATVTMWQATFKDVPFAIMEMAFYHFRRVSKFPPTVADMYEELKKIYWMATAEACTTTDETRRQQCRCIMAYTDIYRGEQVKHSINYNSIKSLPMPMALSEGEK